MNPERKSENDSRRYKFNPLNWQMFALWVFVVASFAALFVAGYVIWVKCHGQ